MKVVVGLTGASGALFAVEFLKFCRAEKTLICSRWGESVLSQETGLKLSDLSSWVSRTIPNDDLSHPLASGSNPFDAMVILPCSASTLSKIACGIADTLMTRAASVALKERRRLVICLRETPLSSIQIENMMRLSQAGAILMPISPPFYQKAGSLGELASLFAERVAQAAGLRERVTGWGSE